MKHILALLLCSTLSIHAATKIVMVAGAPSHPSGQHEFNAGTILLARALNEQSGLDVDVKIVHNGWPEDASVFDGAKAIIHLDGQTIELEIPKGKTILDTLIAQKYDPPYSCTSGSCSTCMAKVISGNAEMEVCYALDDDEVKDGYVLTCQAHPSSPEIELTFEV